MQIAYNIYIYIYIYILYIYIYIIVHTHIHIHIYIYTRMRAGVKIHVLGLDISPFENELLVLDPVTLREQKDLVLAFETA